MTERGLEKEWMLRELRKVGRSEVVLFVASRAQGRKGNIGQGGERNGGGGGRGEWVQNGQGKFWDEKLLCLISYETEVRNILSFIKSEASFYL